MNDYCEDCVVLKQKTAYEMRIGDWSSDVCSSDLSNAGRTGMRSRPRRRQQPTHDRSAQPAGAANGRRVHGAQPGPPGTGDLAAGTAAVRPLWTVGTRSEERLVGK